MVSTVLARFLLLVVETTLPLSVPASRELLTVFFCDLTHCRFRFKADNQSPAKTLFVKSSRTFSNKRAHVSLRSKRSECSSVSICLINLERCVRASGVKAVNGDAPGILGRGFWSGLAIRTSRKCGQGARSAVEEHQQLRIRSGGATTCPNASHVRYANEKVLDWVKVLYELCPTTSISMLLHLATLCRTLSTPLEYSSATKIHL
jgi:hypothetical protein